MTVHFDVDHLPLSAAFHLSNYITKITNSGDVKSCRRLIWSFLQ